MQRQAPDWVTSHKDNKYLTPNHLIGMAKNGVVIKSTFWNYLLHLISDLVFISLHYRQSYCYHNLAANFCSVMSPIMCWVGR